MYHLLLVDDERITLNSYFNTLNQSFGAMLDMEKCQYASQVSQRISRPIDILVTDICMPKMTGFEINRLVSGKWNKCQTIFITGNESVGFAQKAIRSSENVVDYVLKLEDDEILLNAVRKAIQKLDGAQSNTAYVHGLEDRKAFAGNKDSQADPAGGTDQKSNQIPIEIITAVKYIDSHIDEELSLTKIAEMVFLSPNYFSKLFKQTTGIGYCDYIIEIRMRNAQMLLLDTTNKIGVIAKTVGFESTPYFNRTFKSFFGCTPQEYRKKSLA